MFKKSALFLGRYSTLALMNRLFDYDPDHDGTRPAFLKTVDITYYIKRYEEEIGAHKSEAEIREQFAEHADWILAQQLAAPAVKWIVDIPAWHKFCEDIWKEKTPRNRNRTMKPYQFNAEKCTVIGKTPEYIKRKLERVLAAAKVSC